MIIKWVPVRCPAWASAGAQGRLGVGRRAGLTRLDRPWHRQGAARYALARLLGLLRPPVEVYEPASGSPEVLQDLPVAVRDGTVLRVNVVLPTGGGRFPVLISAHPYGKDNLPVRRGRRWRVSAQYRILRQASRVRFSSLTGWRPRIQPGGPPRATRSPTVTCVARVPPDGESSLFSDQEAEDVYDLIEWAAVQPWSTGRGRAARRTRTWRSRSGRPLPWTAAP